MFCTTDARSMLLVKLFVTVMLLSCQFKPPQTVQPVSHYSLSSGEVIFAFGMYESMSLYVCIL